MGTMINVSFIKFEIIKFEIITLIFFKTYYRMIHIYKINEPTNKGKIAAFDYDWTLVRPNGKRKFPKDVDDWTWLYENIPEVLKRYEQDGYMIVIFTNQSKLWKLEQLQKALSTLEIPLHIVVGYSPRGGDKADYKPNPQMFYEVIKGDFDKESSFFVGDALGRNKDFSDSDKVFAENIGISWEAPETFFRK